MLLFFHHIEPKFPQIQSLNKASLFHICLISYDLQNNNMELWLVYLKVRSILFHKLNSNLKHQDDQNYIM